MTMAGNNCGIGPKGFEADNDCAKGSGSYAAAKMPEAMTGKVQVFDTKTGNVFTTADAKEVRAMFKEELALSGTLDGMSVRQSTPALEAKQAKKESDFWESRAKQEVENDRQRSLVTPSGVKPGHNDYVDPPVVLYHATFDADAIVKDGFKSGRDLGKQTLGGTSDHLVSFTTQENATLYRDGLEIARVASKGSMTNDEMIDAASKFGVNSDDAKVMLEESKGYTKDKASFNFFQQVSFKGKKFPLFMGGNWPSYLKDAKAATVVGIRSSEVKDILYSSGEKEWRVGDYKKVKAKRIPTPTNNTQFREDN